MEDREHVFVEAEFWSVGARKVKQVQPPTAKLEAHADELQCLQKQIMAFLRLI